MMVIRNLGDLKKVLAVYDDALPVQFTSSESGGYWPKHRDAMVVPVDECVHEVHAVDGKRHLNIALLNPTH